MGHARTLFLCANCAVPFAFLAYDTPYHQYAHLDADTALFLTDTWHVLALTAGIRLEYLSGEIQAEQTPAGRFVGPRSVPETTCQQIKGMGCWWDWTPRIGGVYDVFGNHKTAIKAGFGKYNTQYATALGRTGLLTKRTPQRENVREHLILRCRRAKHSSDSD
jgi:hypothetical protein